MASVKEIIVDSMRISRSQRKGEPRSSPGEMNSQT